MCFRASLVPCIVFGEVDCYSVVSPREDCMLGRLVANIQLWVYRWTGINPVLYRHPDHNQGFLSLPKPTPITVVSKSDHSIKITRNNHLSAQ